MSTLLALLKKETMEQLRTGKLLILPLLFSALGVMNPAIAKLTPWLMSLLADSLAESGILVTEVSVSALDSWMQFFKNMPIGLIVLVLLESGTLTGEYSSGTLVLSLTKGVARSKVILAKTFTLTALWTACYTLCVGITYAYNAYYWDNGIAQSLWLSLLCWWLFGLWIIGLITLLSVLSRANTGVLLGTGGIVLACYLVGLIPKVERYLPTRLTDGVSLIYGSAEPSAYLPALLITAALSLLCPAISIPLFDRKQL